MKILHTHIDGIDLKIGIEEAKKILEEEKEEYQIPLQITKPEITTDKFAEEAFPEKLSNFSTRYDASNKNRANNVELATKAIDGLILLPNENFSFNGIVGPRTKEKGYLLASAYSGGEIVESYGGGVCQVSSTLYNSVLYANLEILERYNHSAVVSYVDSGRDATVSYGTRDFKFKNNRAYAIKIKAEAKNGILTIEVWGISDKEDYEVEIKSEVKDISLFDTKYIYDSSLGRDEEIVEAIGANGMKSVTYKILKKNGAIVSKDILSEDIYKPLIRIIKTGNKMKKL